MKRFDGTVVDEADARRFRSLVKSHRWIFAKTYAAFCPHEYSLRREWKVDEDFEWFAKFVWDNGFFAKYGKNTSKYFIDEEAGWYYFVFVPDMDESENIKSTMSLINRASLGQWEVVEEANMFGTEWRWKRLPKERRKPVN